MTNMGTLQNFVVISDKFNVANICINIPFKDIITVTIIIIIITETNNNGAFLHTVPYK
jgi:hypothetical protein